jgi:hypothetical protein
MIAIFFTNPPQRFKAVSLQELITDKFTFQANSGFLFAFLTANVLYLRQFPPLERNRNQPLAKAVT